MYFTTTPSKLSKSIPIYHPESTFSQISQLIFSTFCVIPPKPIPDLPGLLNCTVTNQVQATIPSGLDSPSGSPSLQWEFDLFKKKKYIRLFHSLFNIFLGFPITLSFFLFFYKNLAPYLNLKTPCAMSCFFFSNFMSYKFYFIHTDL